MRKWFILFIISILPLAASAEAVKVGDLWYNLDESAMTAEVTSSGGDSYTGEIPIPSSFEYGGVTYTVVSIGNDAFSSSSITKVELPSSLTSIGQNAFISCIELTSLVIPDGVKSISDAAFYNCTNLSSVTFGNGISSIGINAFGYCHSLTKVVVSDLGAWCAVKFGNFDSNPLYHANHLYSDENTEVTNLVIPSGVTSISRYAFVKCQEITSVLIPSSITSIDEAFDECYNLEKVIVPDISAWCSISFPNQSANPLFHAHHLYSDENTEVTNLVIPSDVSAINKHAFAYCRELVSVTIPNSVTSIGEDAFWECYNLEKVIVTDISAWCSISFSSNYSNPICYAHRIYDVENNEITTLDIPSGITSVNNYAFSHCTRLVSVTFPNSVKTIGNYAFAGLTDTKFGDLPSELSSIGEEAFFNCNLINNLTIPIGCESIGRGAFRGCHGLYKVELPSTLTNLAELAFQECSQLSVVVSKIQSPFEIDKSVFASGWPSEEDGVQVYPKSSATLYVPIGTKSAYQRFAGWDMFAEIIEGELKEITYEGLNYTYIDGKGTATVTGRSDDQLTELVIPASIPVGDTNYSVTVVGDRAFLDCSNITSLTIPSSVVNIGRRAFAGCYSIPEVVIPEGVQTIGATSFWEVGNWTGKAVKITIPSTVAEIGDEAFRISRLSRVTSRIQHPFEISQNVFGSIANSVWNSETQQYDYTYNKSEAVLYVPDGSKVAYLQIAGWNMFADIVEGELKEVTVDGLNYSYIEGKGTAIVTGRANDELRTIIIPGSVPIAGTNYSVKSIAAGAFQNYTNIDTLVIQSGVETIGKNAFQYCYNLKSVTIPEGVKTIGENAFRESGTWGDGLRKIELPSSLDSIGDYAFFYCRNLTSVVSKIQTPFSISENVFAPSWSTEENGVTTWPKSSANLYVPEGSKGKYEAIAGWNMFAGIYEGELLEKEVGDLKYAYLPSTLTATVISGNYSKLNKVTIPGTVEIDGASYQVKEIGTGAFRNCYNLDTVIINNGVEIISDYAFQWCTSADFGTLPSSLRTIGDYGFWNCNMFKNLEIPEGVQTLGSAAFGGCYNLQKVILPSTLTGFGERVFEGSDNLSSVVSHIREPFTISEKVFATNWSWDENNKEVYTPSAATLFVPEGTKAKYEAIPGWTMFAAIYEGELIEQKVGDLYYSYNTSSKYATVVRGDDYSKLTKVEVPSTVELEGLTCRVKEIAPRAFSGTPIASLFIEEGLEAIGTEAFANCQQLSTISLPSSLATLGDAAFRECNRLGSVVIPSGLTSLGYSVFAGCKNLNSLEVAADNEKFESRGSNAVIERSSNTLVQGCNTTVIPSSVTAIGKEAFIYLDIKAITIPSSVKTIGENAFNSCHNLKEVVLPEGLETLGNTAFHSCSGLTMVELPNSLKDIGSWTFAYCNSLLNVVSNIENPKNIDYNTFGEYDELYSRATLWVPKGKINTYKALEGWNRFKLFDELLRDNLTKPTITYNGRYMTMTNDKEQKADIYYSVDGSEPTILYRDTIAMSNLGTILAISKRFGSYTVDTTRYEVTYVYDGVTARTASEGLLAKCFEWSGTDKVEMLDIDGTLNDDDFATIRSLSKLATLNMAASKMTSGTLPAEAFANTKLQWYVSPYTMTGVGANIFKGCNQLSAITWNSSSVELPEDVVTDVANPNMLVYAKAQAMIPYSLKNVVVNGYANNIVLADSAGNNNFYCPEEFIARRISYTHNYQQPTLRGTTQGWETLALPFTVGKITHETKGVITPSTVEGAERPFWLYELGDNGLTAATQIRANIPYLICMPNDDAYGDEYILGGRVTFSAQNVTITTSGGTTVSQGDRQFVPTYKAVAKADGVYALNIGEAYNGNPMGSVFVQNYREVRPFEAYSVHSGNRSRTILLSSLGGGDATGINDLMLKNGDDADSVVKVYSLSGALIKQGKREETLRSLPKGLYIIDGKKIIK